MSTRSVEVQVGATHIQMPMQFLGYERVRGDDHSVSVHTFGNVDVVGDIGLLSCAPNYIELYETLRSLKEMPNAEELTRGNDGGLVVRVGEYAAKYCWEQVSSLNEGIATEILRVGLDQIDDHIGPRITVPKVVGGVCTRDGGVLITEYARGYTQARRLDVVSERACDNDSPRRKQLYRMALAMADVGMPEDHYYMFDDGAHNVLWPDGFRTSPQQSLPDDMVCIDFANVGRRLPAAAVKPA